MKIGDVVRLKGHVQEMTIHDWYEIPDVILLAVPSMQKLTLLECHWPRKDELYSGVFDAERLEVVNEAE